MADKVYDDPFAEYMLEHQRVNLQVAVKMLYDHPDDDAVLVVARGDAPFLEAQLETPPDQLKRKVLVGMHARPKLVAVLEHYAPSLARSLKQPDPCGHRPVLFASGDGGSIRCGTCDDELVPDFPKA